MTKYTTLGPAETTFSWQAYMRGARLIDPDKQYMPRHILDYVPASSNIEILEKVCEHGGYGVIAMETRVDGRITEPTESFIRLLEKYEGEKCPVQVIVGHQTQIQFCMMTRYGVSKDQVTKIITHRKSHCACKKRIESMGIEVEYVESNGEAARLVKEDKKYSTYAAIGPYDAARKYNLQVHNLDFEDDPAATTFFMLGPRIHPSYIGMKNRALIVFKTMHEPNSLVNVLMPFGSRGINLTKIHSMHIRNGTYHFAIEMEMLVGQISDFNMALCESKKFMQRNIAFGPFEILSEEIPRED